MQYYNSLKQIEGLKYETNIENEKCLNILNESLKEKIEIINRLEVENKVKSIGNLIAIICIRAKKRKLQS